MMCGLQSNLCKNEINEAVVEHFKQGKERKFIEYALALLLTGTSIA